jgi:hypothetical protein
MPVVYVDRVRAYYDILLRQEPAHEFMRLRASSNNSSSNSRRTPVVATATLKTLDE